MSKHHKDLTKGHLVKNLFILSLPIMFSNFLMMFYNLTDTFWLGKLGEGARGAVAVTGMTFPLVFFLSSFGSGFVIAGSTLIAQYKGAGRQHMLSKTVGQQVLILIAFSLTYVLISQLLLDYFLRVMGTPPEIMADAKSYISIVMIGMAFMYTFLVYQGIMHGMGDMISPMRVQIFSVLLNVVLDPIFIFGWLGMPAMGIKGAAYATLIARFAAALVVIVYFVRKEKKILPGLHDLIPDKELLRRIIKISIPSSLSQSLTSFGFLLLQGFVNSYGTVVMTAFSIGNRMTGIFMMPAMGISNALTTVIGQNLGANEPRRAEKSVHIAFTAIFIIMSLCCVFVYFYGAGMTKFFIDDAEVIAVGGRMFKVVAFAALIFALQFIFTGVFNGAGHTRPVLVLAIARLWIFRIPFVYILSGLLLNYSIVSNGFLMPLLTRLATPLSAFPYDALWWSMLLSNILTGIWGLILYKRGHWKNAIIFED